MPKRGYAMELRRLRTHRYFTSLILAAAIITSSQAQEQGPWTRERQWRFAEWQAAHPNIETRIEALKAATSVLLQQRRQVRHDEEQSAREGLIAKWRALSPSRRQQARDL